MSSRALRRLQRERDTELGSVSLRAEVKDDSCTTPDEETSDTADSVQDRDAINHKKSSAPTNLFDLVMTVVSYLPHGKGGIKFAVCVCLSVVFSKTAEWSWPKFYTVSEVPSPCS